MNEENRDDTRRKVTSVGNSWIVCKSRSHSGYVYYFNTLTGEAAWNLSDAEIERAKRRTKHLECLPGAKPTSCPEPKDKPPNKLLKDENLAQWTSHKPFVINSVTDQQSSISKFSNNPNNNATFSNINQIAALMQSQINNASSVNPVCKMNSFNNSISTFNFNTSPSIYNPKVWAIPQTQTVFIAPSIVPVAPVVNHSSAPQNFAYNNLTQSSSQPVSGFLNNVDNVIPPGIFMSGTGKFNSQHYTSGQDSQQNLNKYNLLASQNDLRQKLFVKKRFNVSSGGYPGESGIKNMAYRRSDINAHGFSTDEGIHTNDFNNRNLENRCLETQLQEKSTRIDLGPLKCLAPSDAKTDAWFIVVDLNVLLNEFKFLNILTDSDDQCHLMIPKRVMEELKTYVTCTVNIQARRILRFLTQQIEIGYAFVAEKPSGVEGETVAEQIHATCTELSENKFHLILLCDDNELLNYKDTSSINIFSIDEVKRLLMNNPNKQQVPSVPKKPFMIDQLINKIKITVPNDAPQNIDMNTPDLENIAGTDFDPIKSNTENKAAGESAVLKRTADAGIQTDFQDINAQLTSKTDNQELSIISKNSQNSKETIVRSPVLSVLNIPDKKREIKLKRGTSNQPAVPSVESVKKQFKWRRRRTAIPRVTGNKPSYDNQNTNSKGDESLPSNTLRGDIYKQPDNTISNNSRTFFRNENIILDDSIESSSSIYNDQRNTSTKDNVTIEETSTSGIISNTESNVDAESNYSNSFLYQQQSFNNEPPNNEAIYEIDNTSMAEYLKVKCDEWISRYIQIMEEVLSQVLQQDPPFSHSAMPPPWTLHEAAQCVAIKFSTRQDVKKAANKLSSMLFCVSDDKGKISMDMTPQQYMQMYSYGVHLLAAIMKVTNNCEDIKIAVDSLKKLLDDIRNPNMDISTNDTFNDNDNDQNSSHSRTSDGNIPHNNTTVFTDVRDNFNDNGFHEQEPDHNQYEEGHNHKLKKRKLSDEESQKSVKFIRNINIKSSFFEKLNLKKVNAMKNGLNEVNMEKSPKDTTVHGDQDSSHSQISNGKNLQNNSLKIDNVSTNQPTIIRNFRLCPQFENRLKSKYNISKVYEDHDDDLDYDEDYSQYITEECNLEDENHKVQHNLDHVNQTDGITDTNENCEPERPFVVETLLNNDNSAKFKYMMGMLLQEVRKALCQVKVLCEQCYEELNNPTQSTEQKTQLRKKAETAHLHIGRLSRSLESMLDHETNNQNVCNLLKQVDINPSHVDDGLLLQYRISVAKCKDHVDEFLTSIQNVISAFG